MHTAQPSAYSPRHPDDSYCVAGQCLGSIDPECPVPLCEKHARLVFAYIFNDTRNKAANPEYNEPFDYPDPRNSSTPHSSKTGWVYFIRIHGLIKIGWTSNPQRRFAKLLPTEVLHLQPGTMREEKQLHFKFRHLLAWKHEYFRPDPELIDYINTLQEEK